MKYSLSDFTINPPIENFENLIPYSWVNPNIEPEFEYFQSFDDLFTTQLKIRWICKIYDDESYLILKFTGEQTCKVLFDNHQPEKELLKEFKLMLNSSHLQFCQKFDEWKPQTRLSFVASLPDYHFRDDEAYKIFENLQS